jgi:hypothetical protein
MAADEPGLVTMAPPGYLDVARLDEVPWHELSERHTWLLDAIRSAGPGPDVRLPGIRAASLALVAILAELDDRARVYEAAVNHRYECSCGFTCQGLAAFDLHMDQYPPGTPDSNNHNEVPKEPLPDHPADNPGHPLRAS